MKSWCLVFFAAITLTYSNAYSQLWPGYETGRFTGVSSATLRPGGMSPSPYKVDATLFGTHLNTDPSSVFNKDFLKAVFTGGFYRLPGFSKLTSNKTHVFSNFQGPSVLVQVHEKAAVAFAWNMRHMWFSELSRPELSSLFDSETPTLSLNAQNESARILYTSWNEFAIGGGGELWDETFHKFSVGAFVKLIYGTGHMSVNDENINVSASGSSVDNMSFVANSDVSGKMEGLVDDGKFSLSGKPGFGFDVGAEYRHLNPRSCPGASNYKLKVGFALTDIGKVRYESMKQYSNAVASAGDVDLEAFRAGSFSATSDTLEQIFGLTPAEATDFSVKLPMSLRLYLEYNIRRRGIIYNEFHFVFVQFMNSELPFMFRYNITPRFEDDRFGIYVPLTFTNYVTANAGLAIRLKPIIIGSENLFTFWAYDDRGTAMDFYVTVKIPILNPDERIDWKRQMSTKIRK